MARQRTAQKGGGRRRPRSNGGPARSDYFVQPGKRGSVVVLRKPCGNRITPKVCGVMPSPQHAKMLIAQLQKAESVVGDLFLEATDDGIEALEAVLAACRDDVLKRLPPRDGRGGRHDRGRGAEQASSGAPQSFHSNCTPEFEPPASAEPLEDEAEEESAEPAEEEAAPKKKPAARKRRAPRKKPSE